MSVLSSKPPLHIESEFVVFDPRLEATALEVHSDFFKELDQRGDGFKGHLLMSSFAFDSDWETSEMHPMGDEVVVLLFGEATFILDIPNNKQQVTLTEPGSYVIVPRGVWHTAKTTVSTRMLFFTAGEGTQNRPLES